MQQVTFLEAMNYAHSRKIMLSEDFYSLDLNTRQMATTVSFLSSLEQIETVIKAVNKSIADGGTFKDFQKLVSEKGIDLPEHYLDNVFRTNIQNAYGHGRWLQQQRNKKRRPYLMYSAIDDSRVRPSHLALDKIVLPFEHPFWLTHYPPLGFRCRCTVVALTEAQALKYGITPDEKLPQVAEALDWSSHPLQFGDLEDLVNQKINKSALDKEYLLEQKKMIQAEWESAKKLKSLFSPMEEKTKDLFDTVANTVIPLDPGIRPSAIRVLLDYVMKNDLALTNYLNASASSLADDVLKQWIRSDMAAIQAVASNQTAIVAGSVGLQQVAAYQVGQTVQLSAPLLMAESAGDVVIQIENMRGLGIDLQQLGLDSGVLMPIGLSFEVIAIETIKGKLTYKLKALVN
ncbi:phage minor head protein (plasmid) [Acinetobacter thermotolerans]|uniref:phage head morphogenesis protein n=1 Tax=Acinetobacter thermotolerans TaxID=3151487 RepID=UPI00325BB9C0